MCRWSHLPAFLWELHVVSERRDLDEVVGYLKMARLFLEVFVVLGNPPGDVEVREAVIDSLVLQG